MTDYDDVQLVALAGPGGWIGFIILVIVLVLAIVNDDECSQKQCPGTMKPKLMHHECLCVESAH